jgi:hypothetical protein
MSHGVRLYIHCPIIITSLSFHSLQTLCVLNPTLFTKTNVLEYANSSSQAMEVSSGSLLLTALDHRAASYEKLDKLQAALRDSKEMIELNPDLAKVYSHA